MKLQVISLIFLIFVQGCRIANKITVNNLEKQETEVTSSQIDIDSTSSPTYEAQEDPNTLMLRENLAGFEMIETSTPSNIPEYAFFNPENTSVFNSTRNFRAFFVCVESCHIFVEDVSTGRTYEIMAPYILKGRPFSSLTWTDTTVIEFDQSRNPYQAVRFVVDVENHTLLNVYPVSPEE